MDIMPAYAWNAFCKNTQATVIVKAQIVITNTNTNLELSELHKIQTIKELLRVKYVDSGHCDWLLMVLAGFFIGQRTVQSRHFAMPSTSQYTHKATRAPTRHLLMDVRTKL